MSPRKHHHSRSTFAKFFRNRSKENSVGSSNNNSPNQINNSKNHAHKNHAQIKKLNQNPFRFLQNFFRRTTDSNDSHNNDDSHGAANGELINKDISAQAVAKINDNFIDSNHLNNEKLENIVSINKNNENIDINNLNVDQTENHSNQQNDDLINQNGATSHQP
jgi:signal recognition particle GTPase